MQNIMKIKICIIKNNFFHFYTRKQLLLSAHLSHQNSVCSSVCSSHGWISRKRCNLGLPNLQKD